MSAPKAILVAILLLLAVVPLGATAATVVEEFQTNPIQRGWRALGETNLFRHDATNRVLQATWDSSKPNSAYYHSLGTILSRSDDFRLRVVFKLNDLSIGNTPGKPYGFELSLGFFNSERLIKTNFLRGSGINAATGPVNLAELVYFPDDGFGATFSPTLISSNNQFATEFSFPLELDAGADWDITLRYTATNQTFETVALRNGVHFGPIASVVLRKVFNDFRLDSAGIISYSDQGSGGSVLAHAEVRRIEIETAAPPMLNFTLEAVGTNTASVAFDSVAGWSYRVEQSADLLQWQPMPGGTVPGTGQRARMTVTNSIATGAFYRLATQRP